jgi:hypothetical protein
MDRPLRVVTAADPAEGRAGGGPLLATLDRAFNGVTEVFVHFEQLLARPCALLLVAGQAWCIFDKLSPHTLRGRHGSPTRSVRTRRIPLFNDDVLALNVTERLP